MCCNHFRGPFNSHYVLQAHASECIVSSVKQNASWLQHLSLITNTFICFCMEYFLVCFSIKMYQLQVSWSWVSLNEIHDLNGVSISMIIYIYLYIYIDVYMCVYIYISVYYTCISEANIVSLKYFTKRQRLENRTTNTNQCGTSSWPLGRGGDLSVKLRSLVMFMFVLLYS